MEFLTDWKLWVDIGRVIEFSSVDSFDVVAHPVILFSLTTSLLRCTYHDVLLEIGHETCVHRCFGSLSLPCFDW